MSRPTYGQKLVRLREPRLKEGGRPYSLQEISAGIRAASRGEVTLSAASAGAAPDGDRALRRLERTRRVPEKPGTSPDQGDRGAGRSGGEPAAPPDRGRVRLRGGGTVAEEIAILSGVSRALASSSPVRRSALASDGGTR
ncbi:hypothetical protein [Microtetraspora malaysiensis]|uniref:hypothetical protein n=1 Tax=Microtetraspora malaysiensis TaxID=161358 RepID=UPI003D8A1773